MFRFQYEGKTYAVSFKHNRNDPTMAFKGYTKCRLLIAMPEGGWTQTGECMALCSRHDNWNKATGRKVALARVLEVHPRKFRTLVWHCYHLMSNRHDCIFDDERFKEADLALETAGMTIPVPANL